MPSNLTDLKSWPATIFQFLFTSFLGLLIFTASGLYTEVKELNKTIIRFNETLSGTIKDYSYLKNQVDKMEVRIDKHIERSEAEKRELREEIEILKYQNQNRR